MKREILRHIDLAGIIRDILHSRSPRRIRDEQSRYVHAAVLFPLFRSDGEYRVLFTQRTQHVEKHKGQISFPGGAVEKGDGSFQETALREAYEEIGLMRGDVEILGRLDDTVTVTSNFLVHAFVGLIPYPYPFRIDPVEVERILHVPFEIFFSEDPKYRKETTEFEGATYPTPAYLYRGDLIWGATARIIEDFVEVLKGELDLPAEAE